MSASQGESLLLGLVGAIFGALALRALWPRPCLLGCLTLVWILFTRTIEHLVSTGPISLIDDLLVVLCLGRALTLPKQGHRTMPSLWCFGAFFCFGTLSGLVADVAPRTTLAGAFLALKGILIGWAFSRFPWTDKALPTALRAIQVLATLIILSAITNSLVPGPWASVLSIDGGVSTRYGLTALTGLFVHPFDLAFAASSATIAILAIRPHAQGSLLSNLLILSLIVVTISTVRRKDVIGLLLALMVIAILRQMKRPLIIGSLGIVATMAAWPTALAMIVDDLATAYLGEGSREARTVLTEGALQVANTYFPLGAGFGMYGSREAAANYSPLYEELGFPRVAGLRPRGDGSFLTDTSWPAVIGEAGWIGAACFALGLLLLFTTGVIWSRQGASPPLSSTGTALAALVVLVGIESLGAPVFTSPPAYPYIFALAGFGWVLAERARRKEQQNDEDARGCRPDPPLHDDGQGTPSS